uniref:Cytochrome c oxidase subunit 3 n=1 Tax=Podura aquatica TaxID=50589 RepID=Q6DVG2_9HEXA|nr:cytochrome c oxidase subunit III [Podura aquatica]AAT69337.1 cytochrome c oxidase subunit 3 [Podura aquatica]
MMIKSNHSFHMVDQSPWPLFASLSAMALTSGMVLWFNSSNPQLMLLGVTTMMFTNYQWWRDVSRESTYQGLHTIKVMMGMRWGMILFITSEVLFFFSFFWAFFHSSLSPSMEIGLSWPPMGVQAFEPTQVPLLNTIILLASGVTVTWSHHAILENNLSQASKALALTIFLGIYFSGLQMLEYWEANFTFADSCYGSTFFIATGFHGLHVIIGSSFLLVCLIRMLMSFFSSTHHFGFEAAAWYWHFVDVVWLFLYLTVYWWGN